METQKERIKDSLNPALIKQQGLIEEEVDLVVDIHVRLEQLFAEMKATPVSEKEKLRKMAQEVTEIDFSLQVAWKFPRNERFHSWWFRAPHCICPKLDNWDRVGTKQKVVNLSCPVHGDDVDASAPLISETQEGAIAMVETFFAEEEA